jgi:two-component system OmpR family response regulator
VPVAARRALPLSAAEPTGPPPPAGDFCAPVSTVEHTSILIIEDEPSVADALRLILEDRGHRVLLATAGAAGLRLARGGGVRLVITDLFLPDLSGLDVLRALAAELPLLPVVLITSQGTPEVFAEARRAGAAAFLHKPFAPDEILRVVESFGRR